MANGIGRVWAANAGDDEQKPNGVGSVWIENIEALTPSGGASEQQINELSAAIDYVSANAGDPNALTGYQEAGVGISATSSLFVTKGGAGYVISANPGVFEVSGNNYDLNVCYGGHLSSTNGASAVFTNGSLVSADSNNGFLVSAGSYPLISAALWGLEAKNGSYYIKADKDGLDISANPWDSSMPLKYRNFYHNISLADQGFAFNTSATNYSAWIDNVGTYGVSAGGYNSYIASIGGWDPYNTPATTHYVNGIGFSGGACKFGVFHAGNLQVFNAGNVSALNGCSATFRDGSRTEVSNGHVLLVGVPNGIYVSGNGIEQLNIYNGGSVKASDGGKVVVTNAAELNLNGVTYKIGMNLNASGSRFISADGEGVSAWANASMDVIGQYNQTSSNAAFVIGNGSANTARSDLFVIDYSGNAKSNDFIAGNGNKLSDSVQTSELEYDQNDAITAIAGSAIGGQSEPYFETAVSSTQDFVIPGADIERTVTGTLVSGAAGPTGIESTNINSADLGVDLTKVTLELDLNTKPLNSDNWDIRFYGTSGETSENAFAALLWDNWDSFKNNFTRPFQFSSTFTGAVWTHGDLSNITSISSISLGWNYDRAYSSNYTATFTEQPAPKSFIELYNAFTAYTASHP